MFNHLDPYSRYEAPEPAGRDRDRRWGQATTGIELGGAPGAISVRSVQMTPLVDGSGVAFGRALDFSAASGWLVQGLDNTFTPVTGKFSGKFH